MEKLTQYKQILRKLLSEQISPNEQENEETYMVVSMSEEKTKKI